MGKAYHPERKRKGGETGRALLSEWVLQDGRGDLLAVEN
jgi:hypothetical protein